MSKKQKPNAKDEFDNNNKKDDKKQLIIVTIISILLVAGLFIGDYFLSQKQEENELPYTELINNISTNSIEKIEMTTGSSNIKVILKGEEDEKERTKSATIPSIQPFVELVQEKIDTKAVDLELVQKPINNLLKAADTIFSLLPTILLVVLMYMIFKMQGLGSDSAKVYNNGDDSEKSDIRFTDIAGLDEEKGELLEIVDFLKKPKKYREMGAKIPRGILLYGKPGTGKTLIAKAIAGEAEVPFISMSGSEFIEMFAGLGASRVRKLFEKAKKLAPCIIFIDEIDAIGSRRTSNSGAETENNQTLNQLLVEMDGFNSTETVIVLAATNRPEMLDKALLRPGRFDRQITVPAPDLVGRESILKLHAQNKKVSDEIDAIGSRRTSNSGAETENNQTLNQLLVEMDGFGSEETIIVLAATNRPEMLDKALLRPGRFDRRITIPVPDLKGRLEILKIHSKNKKIAEDVNLESIAEDTAGFTGAELENILNEAAIIATKNKHDDIENNDIEEAVKKVTVGLEKHTRTYSDKDKKLTAYHEAGHAVVSRYLPTQTDVKEISIIPRGVAGGYTMYKSDEDKYYISKTEMEEKLIALLGGRAAEKLVLDDISTGASNDIEVATGIARDMVTKYGMSDKLGPIDFQGKEPYEMQLFGEDIGDKIGAEVKTLIDTAYRDAIELLKQHRDKLDLIAMTLLEKEKIKEEDFKRFFEE